MKTLGKYHILDTLGKGGFATVYKARDPDLDRAVALKVMEPLLMRDPVWVKRFRQEARAIAQLKHPHIITIYEIGQAEGILFIAMELAEDGSLEARLQQGPLPWARALELAQQVAAALDHAHARGVIHRDLKPANILLDPDVGAILTDFGFARLIADHSLSVTMSGGMVGTPSYIPPEVWRGQRADKPADVYALGAIVYEMITGQKRFDAPSPPAVMMAHFSPPPWPEAWPEDVPPGVVDVLARATEQDPNARFETAGELVEALAGLSIDRLAEPYAELEAAIAAGAWQQALALADAIRASDPDYRDVAALEQRALAGMEAEARRAQAQQWKQAAEEALAAGNLDAAELALVQWASLDALEEERLELVGRMEELKAVRAQQKAKVRKEEAPLRSEKEEGERPHQGKETAQLDEQQAEEKEAQKYFEIGKRHHDKGEYDKAIAIYTKAIRLYPCNAEYYYHRGKSYHSAAFFKNTLDDYQKAIADFTKAIQCDPQNAKYYSARGKSYHNVAIRKNPALDYVKFKTDQLNAITDKTQAIELGPDNADYYYSRYLSYQSMGKSEDALTDLARARELGYED